MTVFKNVEGGMVSRFLYLTVFISIIAGLVGLGAGPLGAQPLLLKNDNTAAGGEVREQDTAEQDDAEAPAAESDTKTAPAETEAPLVNLEPESPDDNQEPLVITANQTLEWHRGRQVFIARGQARARQGETTIEAAELKADYRDTAETSFDIHTLTATDNVVITTPGHAARGDKAVYDVTESLAVMTGDNLVLNAPDQTITARDRFEYQTAEGRLSAFGAVKIIRGDTSLSADKVSAFFKENEQGERVLERAVATGNIVIKTPTETLYGERGVYTGDNQVAEIYDNVRIVRGPNTLEGDRAQVNLRTDVSKIFGAPTADGRVRGVFYPDSE